MRSAIVGVTMSFFAETNGGSEMIVRRWGDVMSRAVSSKASRYCVHVGNGWQGIDRGGSETYGGDD